MVGPDGVSLRRKGIANAGAQVCLPFRRDRGAALRPPRMIEVGAARPTVRFAEHGEWNDANTGV